MSKVDPEAADAYEVLEGIALFHLVIVSLCVLLRVVEFLKVYLENLP